MYALCMIKQYNVFLPFKCYHLPPPLGIFLKLNLIPQNDQDFNSLIHEIEFEKKNCTMSMHFRDVDLVFSSYFL